MDTRTLLKARIESFESFRRWHETEDPSRIIAPAEGLRWAGRMLEFMVRRGFTFPEPGDYAGVRIMHERLALLRPLTP